MHPSRLWVLAGVLAVAASARLGAQTSGDPHTRWEQQQLGTPQQSRAADGGLDRARDAAQAQFDAARKAHDLAMELSAAQRLAAISPGDAGAQMRVALVEIAMKRDRAAAKILGHGGIEFNSMKQAVAAANWYEWLSDGQPNLPIIDSEETKQKIADFDALWLVIDNVPVGEGSGASGNDAAQACAALKKPPAAAARQPALLRQAAYCDSLAGHADAAAAAYRAYVKAAPQSLDVEQVSQYAEEWDRFATLPAAQQKAIAAAGRLETAARPLSAAQAWDKLLDQIPPASPAYGSALAEEAELRLKMRDLDRARRLVAAAEAAGVPAWRRTALNADLASAQAAAGQYPERMSAAEAMVREELAWLYRWPRPGAAARWTAENGASTKCYTEFSDPKSPSSAQLIAALNEALEPLRQVWRHFPYDARANRLLGEIALQRGEFQQAFAAESVAADAGLPIDLYGLFRVLPQTNIIDPLIPGPVYQPPFRFGGQDYFIPVRLEVTSQATRVFPLAACDGKGQAAAWSAPPGQASFTLDPSAIASLKTHDFQVNAEPVSDRHPSWQFAMLPAASPAAGISVRGPMARNFADGQLAVLQAMGGWKQAHLSHGLTDGERFQLAAALAGLATPLGAGMGGLAALLVWRAESKLKGLASQADPLPQVGANGVPGIVPLQMPPAP
jgi:hypothetical protein